MLARPTLLLSFALGLAASSVGCARGGLEPDAGSTTPGADAAATEDAGGPGRRDAGRRLDGGGAEPDAAEAFEDAGARPDAGHALPDAGLADAGPADAGPADAGSGGCEAALAAARFDFEGSGSGFSHYVMDGVSGGWPFDDWEPGSASSGPGSCAQGSGCWATNLSGNYVQCQRAELRSPAIDLSACAGRTVELVFEHAYSFWSGVDGELDWYDGGLVEVSSDGFSWSSPSGLTYPGTIYINPDMGWGYSCLDADRFYADGRAGFVGGSASWEQVRVALDASLLTGPFYVRFAYASGVSYQTTDPATSRYYTEPGWYIDDVRFELR